MRRLINVLAIASAVTGCAPWSDDPFGPAGPRTVQFTTGTYDITVDGRTGTMNVTSTASGPLGVEFNIPGAAPQPTSNVGVQGRWVVTIIFPDELVDPALVAVDGIVLQYRVTIPSEMQRSHVLTSPATNTSSPCIPRRDHRPRPRRPVSPLP
jgi:hypothetical protein